MANILRVRLEIMIQWHCVHVGREGDLLQYCAHLRGSHFSLLNTREELLVVTYPEAYTGGSGGG